MEVTMQEGFQFSPFTQRLFLEASTSRGVVSGMALGMGWHPGSTELFYLISDLGRPAPTWVGEDEVRRQRWTSGTLGADSEPLELAPRPRRRPSRFDRSSATSAG